MEAAGRCYTAAIGASAPATVARFNGIFWGVFMGTYVVGPALAFVALQGREDSGDSGWLFPAYTAIAVAGALVLAFVVRPLDSRLADAVDEEAEHRGSASLEDAAPQQAEVLETSRLIPEAPAATNASLASTWFATLASDACFVPLLLLNGALQAYMWGPFAASYVKPRIHEAQVGVVTAIFGLADMASASLAGHFAGASDAPGDGAEDCAETARAPEKRAAANPAYARACAFLAAAHVVFAVAVGGVLTGVLARGAPGLYAAAAATGVRVFTATSSQGLLYGMEALFTIASWRVPLVLLNVSRGLSAPITLGPDHNDVLAARDSGFVQLHAETCQEVLDTVLMGYRIAEDPRVSLPVLVNMDGFFLSFTREPVEIPDTAAATANISLTPEPGS